MSTSLKTPQARVLKALMPKNGKKSGPALTRVKLAVKAGFEPTTGTVNLALHGIAKNSLSASHGDHHKGVLGLGLVEKISVDSDGVSNTVYCITSAGVKAFKAYIKEVGKLPPVRDKKACVNLRYVKSKVKTVKNDAKVIKEKKKPSTPPKVKKSATKPKKARAKPTKTTPVASVKAKKSPKPDAPTAPIVETQTSTPAPVESAA